MLVCKVELENELYHTNIWPLVYIILFRDCGPLSTLFCSLIVAPCLHYSVPWLFPLSTVFCSLIVPLVYIILFLDCPPCLHYSLPWLWPLVYTVLFINCPLLSILFCSLIVPLVYIILFLDCPPCLQYSVPWLSPLSTLFCSLIVPFLTVLSLPQVQGSYVLNCLYMSPTITSHNRCVLLPSWIIPLLKLYSIE